MFDNAEVEKVWHFLVQVYFSGPKNYFTKFG